MSHKDKIIKLWRTNKIVPDKWNKKRKKPIKCMFHILFIIPVLLIYAITSITLCTRLRFYSNNTKILFELCEASCLFNVILVYMLFQETTWVVPFGKSYGRNECMEVKGFGILIVIEDCWVLNWLGWYFINES